MLFNPFSIRGSKLCVLAFHGITRLLDQNKASVLRQLMKTADEAWQVSAPCSVGEEEQGV